ncbi:hypothetical protein WJT74_01825 [Sphingomicrobium sp. XHP0239]|uniref:hypothetical protein n=1 Tax=Sphingomicrobium maritimum TaxID=3133972 RepID=UPI0031CC4572
MPSKDKVVALHLEAGATPRMKSKPNRISKAQDTAFFDHLAASCNVKRSAQAAGISPQHCYSRRRSDAAYRRRWEDALAEGYAKLELALLERAILGSEKVTTAYDEEKKEVRSTVVREYSNALAMSLLKMHRETVELASQARGAGFDEQAVREARAAIETKLELLSARAAARLAETHAGGTERGGGAS